MEVKSFPRARGDGPTAVRTGLDSLRVFPAHAGMDRRRCRSWTPNSTFSPRTRGWTAARGAQGRFYGRFPRARGDGPVERLSRSLNLSVFPAHAGMDRMALVLGACGKPFSPRTRGWTVPQVGHLLRMAVFPAHAGMDRWTRLPPARPALFSPRTRGWTASCPSRGSAHGRFPRARGDGPKYGNC